LRGDVVAPTGMTVGRTSGAQKMACSPQDPCGSWAKADTPPPPEFRGYLAIRTVGDHRFVVTSIVDIATQTFPGDVGDVSILQALVRLRRPPVEFRHCFRPIHKANEDCGAIILIDWVVGSPYFGTTWCHGKTTNQPKKIVLSTDVSRRTSSNSTRHRARDGPARSPT
jgi:hypothetical protein